MRRSGIIARVLVAARWPLVIAWIVAAVAAGVLLPGLGSGSAPIDDIVPANASALQVQQRSAALFGAPAGSDVGVVQRRAAGLTSADITAHARAAAAARSALGMRGALPLVNVPLPGMRWNETRTTVLDVLFIDPSISLQARTATARAYGSSLAVAGPRGPDNRVGVTGAGPARLAQFGHIEDVLPWVTIATIGVILLLTSLYFRSPGAPLVTLASAGIAYVIAVHGAAWLSGRVGVDVPREIEPVLVVLLLGLSTDYCVFFLADARRRLLAGATRADAARGAVTRIGPTVLTAGAIVAACSAALLAGRLDFFRVFGPGMAFCALVVTIVALTFVPAVLAIAGPRLFGRRAREAEGTAARRTVSEVPVRAAARAESARRARWRRRLAGTLGAVRAARRDAQDGGRRARTAALAPRILAARPVAFLLAVVCVGGLLWGAAQAREIQLGVDPVSALPADDPVRIAGDDAKRGFAGGILAPTEIVLEGPRVAADTAGLERLRTAIARRPAVAASAGARAGLVIRAAAGRDPMVSRDQNAARIVVVVRHDATSAQGLADFRALRAAMPTLVRQSGLPAGTHVAYAGEAALGAETVDAVRDDLVRVAIAIALVTFVLLVLFLRALVAPLLLLAAGALGYLASLGLTSLMVREVTGDRELTFFVPLVGGVLLLALGSDYNVLVAGRVRAESARRRAREAIAVAVPQASRAITLAGVTLAGTFALLGLVPVRPFRELAVLLCVGVLLDALIIRSVLIPSLLSLAGDGAWWPARGRREQPLTEVLGRVSERTGLSRPAALDATTETLRTLGERIGDAQASELAVHLPPSLGAALEDPEGCEPFDAEVFVERVAQRREVDVAQARAEACAVLRTLRDLLPPTEMDYVRAALTEDYRPLVDGDGEGDQAGDGLFAPGPGRTVTS